MKMFKFAVFSLLLAAYVNGLPAGSLVDKSSVEIDVAGDWKIVGGSNAPDGAFPFMASLRPPSSNFNFCGGTVLTNAYILTAAHCLTGTTAAQVVVWAGTNTLDSGGESVPASKLIVHESFGLNGLQDDIGLVKLNGYFTLSTTITQVGIVLGTVGAIPATVIGWGGIYSGGPIANDLQELSVSTLTNDQCFSSGDGNTEGRICAIGVSGTGVCNGDSGGPLIAKDTGAQIGLASYVLNGCALGNPDVFTRISPYYDWIINAINSNYNLKVIYQN